MSRRVRDAQLETRTARSKLKPRGKPYYRSIGPDIHLGYRKGDNAHRWVARTYLGNGAYSMQVIGDADDLLDADGETILNFFQAQDRARALVEKQPIGPYTMAQAIADYAAGGEKDTAKRLAIHLPAAMKAKPVDQLTKKEIAEWHRGLAKTPPRARPKAGGGKAYRVVDMDNPEVIRRRKVTANSLLAKFKTVLNHALAEEKITSDKEWSRVKPFEKVAEPRTRYLSVAEAQRLINACDPDFRKLVQAALITGCRYQELARLTAADYNPDSDTLLIRQTKTGKPRHVILSEEGVAFFKSLAAGRQRRRAYAWSSMASMRPDPTHEGRVSEGEDHARHLDPCASAYLGEPVGHGRNASDGGRQEPRARRHQDGREALRSSVRRLRCRSGPQALTELRHQGGERESYSIECGKVRLHCCRDTH